MKTGSWISRKTGSEGPSFDPYHYEEITVHRADGRIATIHIGLGEWMFINGDKKHRVTAASPEILEGLFEQAIGISPKVAHQTLMRLEARKLLELFRKHRHCKGEPKNVSGYPGESFTLCGCGEVLDYHFDRSAIE